MPGTTKIAKTLTMELSVVGLGFRVKKDVRRALAGNVEKSHSGIHVKLVREQENRVDLNAIRVIHDGSGALRGHHLGYLRADVAALLAPLMDDSLLVLKEAKLTSLDAKDEHKTGVVSATFRDKRKLKSQ